MIIKGLKRYCLLNVVLMAACLSFSAYRRVQPPLIVGEEFPPEDMWKSEYVFLKNNLDHFPTPIEYKDAVETASQLIHFRSDR